ncbi:MAG TPA: alpha/beta hydrolase-fold protein [Acidimicrobiales bacterium]|nr:alpha/beta hydrolase-fold protein [Acidimicrobiales bacterium]
MRPWSAEYTGRLEERALQSAALAANPLGDPAVRPLYVYLPPGYDDGPGRRYPVVYVLHGFAGTVSRWAQRPPFAPSYPEAADALFAAGAAPPAILAFVDGWTSLGGSQYLDSPATGDYQRYLCEDVLSFLDAEYRTIPRRAGRALQGHSSGGFGAVAAALSHPELFGAFAAHAPDAYYEQSLLPDLGTAYRALRDRYHGSYEEFLADHAARPAFSRGDDFVLVMVYALAACYSPGEAATVELPFDTGTGELRNHVWSRWLALDPVRMAASHAPAVRTLRGYLDAGRADEHRLDIGAGVLASALREAGIAELSFELFDGRHGGIEHRYPLALTWLTERLASA